MCGCVLLIFARMRSKSQTEARRDTSESERSREREIERRDKLDKNENNVAVNREEADVRGGARWGVARRKGQELSQPAVG